MYGISVKDGKIFHYLYRLLGSSFVILLSSEADGLRPAAAGSA